MNPVSSGIAMFGWLSSIMRRSVVPEPIAPMMKMGRRRWSGSRSAIDARHLGEEAVPARLDLGERVPGGGLAPCLRASASQVVVLDHLQDRPRQRRHIL